MRSQSVFLLAEARANRGEAERARRLCRSVSDERSVEALRTYAVELDEIASKLEEQASRTALLAYDGAKECQEAT
jgi:hypothetical protein